MSKRTPVHHPKARAKWYPGRRRGRAALVARLSQQALVARNARRLRRAAAAVERSDKASRPALQARLSALRARTTVEVDGETFVVAPLSRRR